MNWKFVFRASNLGAGTDRDEAARICRQAGYEFMMFNGIVYFVDENKNLIKTSLTLGDMI